MMRGTLHAGRNEFQVMRALSQGGLPASLPDVISEDDEFAKVSHWHFLKEAVDADHIAVRILQRCWKTDPSARPSALWCSEVLTHRRTRLFDVYCAEYNPPTPPSEYTCRGSDWSITRNPEPNQTLYDAEPLPMTRAASPDLCVFGIVAGIYAYSLQVLPVMPFKIVHGSQVTVRRSSWPKRVLSHYAMQTLLSCKGELEQA